MQHISNFVALYDPTLQKLWLLRSTIDALKSRHCILLGLKGRTNLFLFKGGTIKVYQNY